MCEAFRDVIGAVPTVFDADAARKTLEVCTPPAGAAEALVAGMAGAAPFLARCAEREPEWLSEIWDAPLEATLESLLNDVKSASQASSEADIMRGLRIARRRAALLIALADLGSAWDLDQTTSALTRFSDCAVASVLDRLLADEAATGRMSSLDPARSGLFALAMGKMGAFELNYSSDIDLILLFEPDRLDAADHFAAKERFPKLARRLVKLLSEITVDGYVARVDLRLRPDPSATPAVLSTEAAERYYEAMGRTWERAAHIKARVCAGDAEAGASYLEQLRPFVWRRYLDFAAIEETAGILAKIREVKGGANIAVRGHDVKLGAGGIREIEFFAQTQQLMLGGRDASLREPRTRDALKALVAAGRLDETTRHALDAAYVHLRRLEHAIQMVDDRQTHRAPEDDAGCARVAALMRSDGFSELEAETRAHMNAVRQASALLDPRPVGAKTESDLEQALANLPDSEAARRIVEGWETGHYRALRSEKAMRKLERLTPELLRRMAAASDPMGALVRFDRFLQGLPAGVQLMSLFEETSALLDLITEITAVAPRLAEVLARRSSVLDAVLDPGFFNAPPGIGALKQELAAAFAPVDDYERVLDGARRWAAERRFQIGVGLLRGTLTPSEASNAFADVAEACLSQLFPRVQGELERRFGASPGAGAAVLAMGNLGSREMTATSDVDMIIVYDAELSDLSAGPKQQPAPHFYGKLTQTLTAALTAPTSEGLLYAVDMRLRPSGNAGPLATSLEAFRRYQRESAWVWEHMALTRARPIAGADGAQGALRGAVAEALAKTRDATEVLKAAAEMRTRLDQAHGSDQTRLWALKHGHGALIDVEFIAQAGVLAANAAGEGGLSTTDGLRRLADVGMLSSDKAEQLLNAHALLVALHQIRRVAMEAPYEMDGAGVGVKRVLTRAAGLESFDDVEDELRAAKTTIRAAFEELILNA